jgi:hypothetical protein
LEEGQIEPTVDQRRELGQAIQNITKSKVLVPPVGVTIEGEPKINDLSETDLATLSESRISAALNVPPVLVGLKSGLQNMTYSNYEEARNSFYTETINPLLKRLSIAFSRGLGRNIEFELPNVSGQQPNEEINEQPNNTN